MSTYNHLPEEAVTKMNVTEFLEQNAQKLIDERTDIRLFYRDTQDDPHPIRGTLHSYIKPGQLPGVGTVFIAHYGSGNVYKIPTIDIICIHVL